MHRSTVCGPRSAAHACIPLLALFLAACGPSKAELRTDSLRVEAAAKAAQDSIDAITLVTVDSAIAPALAVDLAKMTRSPSGMYTLDRRKGTGAVADSNKWVMVDYTTWISDGRLIDDTRKKREPRKVLLGHKQVVAAWDEGLRGMREGGQRILVAPPSLGYGAAGKPGTVPSMATLVFDVELRKVY